MKTVMTMIAAALALVLQAAFASAHATVLNSHCTGMSVTDSATSDITAGTSSPDWLNVPEGSRSFNISSVNGCAVITFSGVAVLTPSPNTADSADLDVRTLLDGKSTCEAPSTNETFLSAPYPAPESANSITRVCEHVATGSHTVQVQFRSENQTVFIYGHVLTVTHN